MEQYLKTFKTCVYTAAEAVVETVNVSGSSHKNLKYLDQQKKKIRKEKNAVKKKFKELQRNAETTDSELADHDRH